jgi:hypothetical protein
LRGKALKENAKKRNAQQKENFFINLLSNKFSSKTHLPLNNKSSNPDRDGD